VVEEVTVEVAVVEDNLLMMIVFLLMERGRSGTLEVAVLLQDMVHQVGEV